MTKRINSRAKGARGEREWRDVLKSFGFEARRGQQFSGSPDSPDVISNVPAVHWEVKLVEKLNIYKAIVQATKDKKSGTIPIVAHKKNKGYWYVTLPANSFLSCLRFIKDLGYTWKLHSEVFAEPFCKAGFGKGE